MKTTNINLTKKNHINLNKKAGNSNLFTGEQWKNIKVRLKLNK